MRNEKPAWSKLSGNIVARCRRDPLFFSAHVLGGDQPWRRQADILLALRDAPRVAVRSGHGVGKTWIAARAAIWFLYAHPHSIVLTTAPTHRQVRSILWAEIRRQVRSSRVPLGGGLTETRLGLDDDWFALGLSTDEPERFQGYHAEHLLLIFDEAPGVSPEIYEAARGLLTSRHARMLLIGNPTAPAGPFYDAFRSPGWRTIHIACAHCPNVREDRVIYPRLVTAEWVAAQREEWGETSPAYRSRVLGEFPVEADTRLIPLPWIHAAQERSDRIHAAGGPRRMGVDVARFGGDHTVLLVADERRVIEVQALSKLSTMETAGRVIAFAERYHVASQHVAIDDSGVGGGVTDRLRELGRPVIAVQAAASPASRHFANRRAELFWRLRESLNPASPTPCAIPPRFQRLAGELARIGYRFNSRGRILIDSKDDIRARLGHSPDRADAFALAIAARRPESAAPRAWLV